MLFYDSFFERMTVNHHFIKLLLLMVFMRLALSWPICLIDASLSLMSLKMK